jgi:Uma2 family endonuclease
MRILAMLTDKPQLDLREGMSLDDFMRQSNDQPFELINGQRIDKMPNGFLHGEVLHLTYELLKTFVVQYGLGRAYMEMTFVYSASSNWVRGARVPDIMFYEKTRFENYKKMIVDKNLPLAIVPDFIIEILSPTDNIFDIQDRILFDFDNGVKVIWLIDPQRRGSLVYTADTMRPQRFGEDGVLSASDILPNFTLELSKIWA